jgi:predicted ATP-grasp superfamily ATP-dependent carboligase
MATPETVEVTEWEPEQWATPVVVKARLHAPRPRMGGPVRFEAVIALDRSVAATRVAEIRGAGGAPLLQELLPGRLMAFTAVTSPDARVVAQVQQVAEGTWPPGRGASVRARTVEADAELGGRVASLLGELRWFGIAELQFMLPDDGEPKLIDLNGRFYGSLALSIAAGLNLPTIWACLATDRSLPPHRRAVPGVRYQWMEGDLRRAAVERRGGMLWDLLGCVRYARGAVHGIWSPGDPRPALRSLRRRGGRGLMRGRRWVQRRLGFGARSTVTG